MSTEVDTLVQSCGCVMQRDGTRAAYIGSSFALRRSDLYVTATHCTRDPNGGRLLHARELAVWRPTSGMANVVSVDRHDDADLAVLRLESPDENVVPFESVGAWPPDAIGETVHHFGFSEEPERPPGFVAGAAYVANVRGFQCSIHPTYSYTAARVSIAPLAGHSGGPFFRPDAPLEVVGFYVQDCSGYTPVAEVGPFQLHRVVSRDGIALRLADYRDWLEAMVPRP